MFIVYWPEIAMVTRVVLSSGGAHLLQIAWLQGNTAPYKMEVKLVNDETFSRTEHLARWSKGELQYAKRQQRIIKILTSSVRFSYQ